MRESTSLFSRVATAVGICAINCDKAPSIHGHQINSERTTTEKIRRGTQGERNIQKRIEEERKRKESSDTRTRTRR